MGEQLVTLAAIGGNRAMALSNVGTNAVGLRREKVDRAAVFLVTILAVDLSRHGAGSAVFDTFKAQHHEGAVVERLPEFFLETDFGGFLLAEHGNSP